MPQAKASLWCSYLPLGGICCLEKKKKGSILHGHLNTTEVKHLSTCKHWKTKLAEKKNKKKEKSKERKRKQKKSEYCKLTSTPRSCNFAFFLQNKSLRGNWIQLERVTHFAYWTNTKWTEIITYLWGFTEFQLDWKYKNKVWTLFIRLVLVPGSISLKLVCANWVTPSVVFLNLDLFLNSFSELPRFLIWGPFVWLLNGFRERSVLVWLWI